LIPPPGAGPANGATAPLRGDSGRGAVEVSGRHVPARTMPRPAPSAFGRTVSPRDRWSAAVGRLRAQPGHDPRGRPGTTAARSAPIPRRPGRTRRPLPGRRTGPRPDRSGTPRYGRRKRRLSAAAVIRARLRPQAAGAGPRPHPPPRPAHLTAEREVSRRKCRTGGRRDRRRRRAVPPGPRTGPAAVRRPVPPPVRAARPVPPRRAP
jgi:hypothetical protein